MIAFILILSPEKFVYLDSGVNADDCVINEVDRSIVKVIIDYFNLVHI